MRFGVELMETFTSLMKNRGFAAFHGAVFGTAVSRQILKRKMRNPQTAVYVCAAGLEFSNAPISV